MGAQQGPLIVRVELLLEALVVLSVGGECFLELTERARISDQAVRRYQGLQVVGSKQRLPSLQDVGVEVARFGEPALRPQQVGLLKLQVQRLASGLEQENGRRVIACVLTADRLCYAE
jgi:hypothetical protein